MINTISPPSLIGSRYQLHETLGAGGMGIVYRATDQQTNQNVAIKLLKPQALSLSPDTLERFAREAEALRQLDHPNIVKVLTTLQENDLHYLVMEYISGGSLQDVLQREGRMPISRTLDIALDLSDALARAHRLRIIHRDIKPANVLIAQDGSTRLTDFGVARMGAKERVTEIGSAVGTPDYMAPEALHGDEVDARADIWALGVMLFEMLTGHRPFRGDNITSMIVGVLTHPVPDLEALRPDAPISLVDLVYRMLTKDREARIPSARLVGAELEALASGTPVNAATYGTLRATTMPSYTTSTPPRTTPTLRHNLPAQTSTFIGRESEMTEIMRLMADPGIRLVTILGPGGMGKTRLSLAFAERIVGGTHSTPITDTQDYFLDGVYFIPLDALSSPNDIVDAMADELKYTFVMDERDPKQQLLEHLGDKNALLILDNFEHLLDGAGIAADILRAAPHVKIIATSRERLNLSGETIFNLNGMDFPEWETPENAMEYSAVKLFLQGARRAKPGYELLPDDVKYLARICQTVQGLPLGILLAAAWVEMLKPQEIAEEIARSLDFLETELRDVPERHRSMRAVFQYSWNLLSEDEQKVFMKLSIFKGGFDREAAQEIAGASLRALTALVNKSLLRRSPEGRYFVHELLRQYAEERFVECCDQDEIYGKHAMYYGMMLNKLEPDFFSRKERDAIEKVDLEYENIRSATRWALQHQRWIGLQHGIHATMAFYTGRSRLAEGIATFEEILAVLTAYGLKDDEIKSLYWGCVIRQMRMTMSSKGDYEVVRQKSQQAYDYFSTQPDTEQNRKERNHSLNNISYSLMNQGQYDEAARVSTQALELSQLISGADLTHYYFSIANLGYVEYLRGNYEEARRLYETMDKALPPDYSPGSRALGLNNLGEVLVALGEFDQAAAYFEQAYTTFKAINNRRGMAFTINNLGGIHSIRGNYDEAHRMFAEGYALHKEIGDRSGTAHSLSALANVAFYTGDIAGADKNYQEALAIRRNLGDQKGISDSLTDLADVAFAREDVMGARQLYQQSLEVSRAIGDQSGIARAMIWIGITIGIKDQDEAACRPYFEEGLALAEKVGNGAVMVMAYLGLGEVTFHTEKYAESRAYFHKALDYANYGKAVGMMLFSLIGFASVLVAEGNPIRALELAGLVHRYPRTAINFMTDMKLKYLLDEVCPQLSDDVVQAALERGRELDLDETVNALLAESAA